VWIAIELIFSLKKFPPMSRLKLARTSGSPVTRSRCLR
jgi:hypothetical protein